MIDNNFIKDVIDESQIILKAMLNGIDIIRIVKTWKIY